MNSWIHDPDVDDSYGIAIKCSIFLTLSILRPDEWIYGSMMPTMTHMALLLNTLPSQAGGGDEDGEGKHEINTGQHLGKGGHIVKV